MGCLPTKHVGNSPRSLDAHEAVAVAAESSCEKLDLPDFPNIGTGTPFTVSEVEALYNLFRKISNSVIKDGLIHKEEFHLALFRSSKKENLFVDRKTALPSLLYHYQPTPISQPFHKGSDYLFQKRGYMCHSWRNQFNHDIYCNMILKSLHVFDLFDQKRNGIIEFGEFVRSLSVFHPDTPEEQKAAFAFRLYDLRQTGFIERHELKEMVLALLDESNLDITSDAVEMIVDRTFDQADVNGDGKIDQEEWNVLIKEKPYVLRNMTLPYLKDITMIFPSFVIHSEVSEADMFV